MNTTAADILTLIYSVQYSGTWIYYALFSAVLYYFSASIFTSRSVLFQGVSRLSKPSAGINKKYSQAKNTLLKEETSTENNMDKNNAELLRLKNKLQQLMETEKLYREPELAMADLAKKMQTNHSVLSKVINQCFMMNFNDYINSYRTEDVAAKMMAPEFRNQTLLSIAFDAGFNSKSTFNRAFLKFKGTTPGNYYRALKPDK
jgi:AraC-like DNA-binding protein